jgi:hypothetical protein
MKKDKMLIDYEEDEEIHLDSMHSNSTTFMAYDNTFLTYGKRNIFRSSEKRQNRKSSQDGQIIIKNPPLSPDIAEAYKWQLNLW